MKIVFAVYFFCLGLIRWAFYAFVDVFARVVLGLHNLPLPGILRKTVVYRATFPSAYVAINNTNKAMAIDDLGFSIGAVLSDYAAVAIGLGRSSKKISTVFALNLQRIVCWMGATR